MASYYLDTSALVKRYAREAGTTWISTLVDPARGNVLYTVQITGPELVAALARKVRTGDVTATDATRAITAFRASWYREYQVVAATAAVAEQAMDLAAGHGLRGYDAVHLAAALIIADYQRGVGLSALTFVSADAAQRQVAAVAGLQIENPATHP